MGQFGGRGKWSSNGYGQKEGITKSTNAAKTRETAWRKLYSQESQGSLDHDSIIRESCKAVGQEK